MNDITLNLIVLAVLILIGAGIFLIVRRKQAGDQQELIQMAAQHGWTCESIREPLAWGLRLKSARWTLEALSRSSGKESDSGSSNVSMSTTWQAEAPGSTLLIGPRTSPASLGNIGDRLIRQVLQQTLGADASGLSEVQAGSASFRQMYMLWAQDPVELERLLTPALESALLAWKGEKMLIKRVSGGLSIELRGVRLKKAADLLSLIQIGEILL
jgi:hypothetical protein